MMVNRVPGGDRWVPVGAVLQMNENRLPQSVLAKASLRGNEYAWPFSAVEEAITAAEGVGLATIGGQVQFQLPDGTAELYWLNAESSARRVDESWRDYVERSGAELRAGFQRIVAETDFEAEVGRWRFLREKQAAGVPIFDHLRFVLYFEAAPGG